MSFRDRLHDWRDAPQRPDYLARLKRVYAVEVPRQQASRFRTADKRGGLTWMEALVTLRAKAFSFVKVKVSN